MGLTLGTSQLEGASCGVMDLAGVRALGRKTGVLQPCAETLPC